MSDARLPTDPPSQMTDEERRELERGRTLLKTMTDAVREARKARPASPVTDADGDD